MKATIDKSGKLSIIPENEIESYALNQWWSNFNQGDYKSSLTADIHTSFTSEKTPLDTCDRHLFPVN
jgi:hypothetical protein